MSAPRSSFLRADASDRHGYSNPSSPRPGDHDDGGGLGADSYYNPKPTYASFSPVTSLSGNKPSAASAAKHRSTILVHQKSPLLLATPPQITRSLAYSHPFILPLNKLAGLVTWTTDDPWDSFIVVLVWWLTVLYGDSLIRFAGPIMLVLTLILGMYGRKYSPLSTSGWSNDDDVVAPAAGSGSRAGGGSSSGTATTGSGLGYFLFGIGAGTSSAAKTTGSEATPGKARSRAKNHSIDSTAGAGKKGGLDVGGGAGHAGQTQTHQHQHQRATSEVATTTRHQKTLDEIVETLREFTARCNLLLEPLLELTDFLSTQSTPTSATTRPALTVLFIRILLCTPVWYLLTLPPLRIITTRRVALVFGTVILTWHSRIMRVSRTILWRSATVRRTAALVTGLEFEGPMHPSEVPSYVMADGSDLADPSTTAATAAAALTSKLTSTKTSTKGARRLSTARESELTKALRRARAGQDAGVRFTFILYENQRRWVGLGWTANLFAYERPAWTDEHNNPVPTKDQFELPEVEDGSKMRWRWVEGSRWRVDGVVDEAARVETTAVDGSHQDTWDYDGEGGRMGWVYYDNKWQGGRRGADGWTRWTRRRKWFRDAELVEIDEEAEAAAAAAEEAAASTSTDKTVTGTGTQATAQCPPSPSPSPSHAGTAGTVGTVGTAPTAGSMAGSSDVHAGGRPTTDGAADATSVCDASSVTSGGGGMFSGASIFSFGGGTAASEVGTDAVDAADAAEKAEKAEMADNADASSILSTSSKSRFRPPALHRRVTDASARGAAAPAVTTNTVAQAHPSNGVTPVTISARVRRDSAAVEDAEALSSSVGVAPHSQHSSRTSGGWGYGDEAFLGLD